MSRLSPSAEPWSPVDTEMPDSIAFSPSFGEPNLNQQQYSGYNYGPRIPYPQLPQHPSFPAGFRQANLPQSPLSIQPTQYLPWPQWPRPPPHGPPPPLQSTRSPSYGPPLPQHFMRSPPPYLQQSPLQPTSSSPSQRSGLGVPGYESRQQSIVEKELIDRQIIVDNLDPMVNSEILIQVFSHAGDVARADMIGKGAAIVEFHERSSAERAINLFNRTLLEYKPMILKWRSNK